MTAICNVIVYLLAALGLHGLVEEAWLGFTARRDVWLDRFDVAARDAVRRRDLERSRIR